MRIAKHLIMVCLMLGIIFGLSTQMQGCNMKIVPQEVRSEVSFTIISKECIPESLAKLIEEKKQ